uniref:hypothetical protein n=1 Tax=Geoalkalibacter sp. TaxID=3041440 RepID=UPI00272E1276
WAMLQEPAIELAKGVSQSMEGIHWVGVATVTALAWAGQSCYRAYLQNQKETKSIETQQMANELDLRRWEIFNDAVSRKPELMIVKEGSQEFYNSLLKAGATADQMEIAGKTLDSKTMLQLIRPSRTRAAEVQLNGLCRILKVDSSKMDGFMVEVKFEDGRTFTARLEEAFISTRDEYKRIIQAGEWEKKPVYLMINAREVRGEITKATIIGAKEIPKDETFQNF